jgi:hypothetical protein
MGVVLEGMRYFFLVAASTKTLARAWSSSFLIFSKLMDWY